MPTPSTTPSGNYHGHETPNYNGTILVGFLGGLIAVITLLICMIIWYRRWRRSKRVKILRSCLRFCRSMKTVCQRRRSQAETPEFEGLEGMKYPLKKLEFIEDLGEGVFGLVYKARAPGLLHSDETAIVAVKMLRPTDRTNSTKVENFAQEAKLIATFKHPNLIQLLGVCTEEKCYHHPPGTIACLLFEYMDGGDLCAFLRRHGPNRDLFNGSGGSGMMAAAVTDAMKLSMCTQIACGMKYLTEKNFIHRDLATRNCLISSKDFSIKIADFGLSRCSYESDYFSKGDAEAVPIRWMSPEAIIYGRYSWQSDVWAYGVTLWEIYTYALQPYYSHSNEDVVTGVTRRYETLPKPPNCPDWVYNLMKLCWQYNPHDRPNFITIYSVLEAISLNNGVLPRTTPLNYVEQRIAETQLHSNGNNSNEMQLPGWHMMNIVDLPPPRQFAYRDSVINASDSPESIDSLRTELERADVIVELKSYGGCMTGPVTTSLLLRPLESSDSCLPESPASIPSCSNTSNRT